MAVFLLVFAVTMASAAAGVVVWALIAEASEAWDIAHHGWARGHHRHSLHHP